MPSWPDVFQIIIIQSNKILVKIHKKYYFQKIIILGIIRNFFFKFVGTEMADLESVKQKIKKNKGIYILLKFSFVSKKF